MYEEERTITLSHHTKTRILLVHLDFQHSRNCISQPRYFSRMNFDLRAQCDFVFHNFSCALPKDMIDIEVTIQTVDGIHTYRRDGITQVASYSPWSRQVKLFPSLRKKMPNMKRRSFNTFTQVRETNFGKKRIRRSQKNRKYRKLDMGHLEPSGVTSAMPTNTTTTTTANLSVPSNQPAL